jgi:hypothetical protein
MADHERDDGNPERGESPPSLDDLERWWQAYCRLPEPRPWTHLADIVHARKARVRQAVFDGWPDLGIVAFKDRDIVTPAVTAELVERVHERSTERVVTAIIRPWAEEATKHLANLPKIGAALDKLYEVLLDQADKASFVRYRRVPDKNADGSLRRDGHGKVVMTAQAYVDGFQLALAAQRLGDSAKEFAVLNKALVDSLTPFRTSEIDFSKAPPEVLAWLQTQFIGKDAA